jgi:hypothetical protein
MGSLWRRTRRFDSGSYVAIPEPAREPTPVL